MRAFITILFVGALAYAIDTCCRYDAPWWGWLAMTGQLLIIFSILWALISKGRSVFGDDKRRRL